MSLSREAIICLRAPAETKLPAPPEYKDPSVRFLARPWLPAFTTLPLTRYKRNPSRTGRFELQIDLHSNTYKAIETWIDPTDRIDPLEVQARARTSTVNGEILNHDKEQPLDQPITRFKEDTGRTWEVICWGKEGQLEGWMIDDDSGLISDNSGEARADWRNFYVVIYYESFDGEAGIEVWDSNGISNRLTTSTLHKIRDAIRAIDNPNFAKLADSLQEIYVSSSEHTSEPDAIPPPKSRFASLWCWK